MIELDTSLVRGRIGAMLMSRGTQTPPLVWRNQSNRGAKTMLEAASDEELLDCSPLVDEQMAAAVRALLFLWNGWPTDAEMYAQLAPDVERAYVGALARRQAGKLAEAKTLLQQVGQHQIYDSLRDYAQNHMKSSPATGLERLRGVIAFTGEWEPFAFGDVTEQAREGQLEPDAEQVVCDIQCREFELLLAHCYQAATGKELEKPQPASGMPSLAERAASRRAAFRAASRASFSESPARQPPACAPQPPTPGPPPPIMGVEVLCPMCGQRSAFPESKRGQTADCKKCGVVFRIPLRRPANRATKE